jgi:small-conductance mechanosensitive channel
MKMAKQKDKDNPYSGIAEKVEKIMADIAEQMPKLSANDLAVVQRAIKFLARNTRAGVERLAILQLLGTNESVPGTVLYQLCSQRVEKRVRELQSVGIDIRRWSEVRPDGYYHSVYGWSGFRLWQEHRLLHEGEDKQPSLKRVM